MYPAVQPSQPAFPFSPRSVDATLLTILSLLVVATIIALVRVHRRDRCLKGLDDFHITLAEQGGDLTWGRADMYSTGLEVHYRTPVTAREGHLERSFLFYKDQYSAMEALYRCPKGLSEEARSRREDLIERTANPGPVGRFGLLRTWISMIRDALVQAVGLFIGLAKTHAPGSAVIGSQEKNVTALSSEVIGHVGNAFDPLLERHLFTQVVVEVTSNDTTRSYCGWLQNYTADFLLVLDAFANTSDTPPQPVRPYAPGTYALPGVSVTMSDDGRLHVRNDSTRVYYVARVTPATDDDPDPDAAHPIDAVLPPAFEADVQLPEPLASAPVHVWVGTTDRVDMVVPRRHALVRHAADGSSDAYAATSNSASAPAATS